MGASAWAVHGGRVFVASFRLGGREETSESDIVRVRRLPDGTFLEELPDGSTRPYVSLTKTDWARLEALRVIEQEPEAVINALARTYLPLVPASPDSRS